jgi:hypothetical protein
MTTSIGPPMARMPLSRASIPFFCFSCSSSAIAWLVPRTPCRANAKAVDSRADARFGIVQNPLNCGTERSWEVVSSGAQSTAHGCRACDRKEFSESLLMGTGAEFGERKAGPVPEPTRHQQLQR